MPLPDLVATLMDHSRWSWPLANANLLGAACAILIILAAVATATLVVHPQLRGRARLVAVLPLALLSLVLVVALAHTYSRGGWLSCSCGLLLLCAASTSRAARLVVLAHALVLVLVILVLPGGSARAATMASPGADVSWMTRLDLWRAACILFHDHAWSGIGIDRFAEYYQAWFRAPADHYSWVVVNEPLEMLCSLGWSAALAYGALGGLCWCCWLVSQRVQAPWCAGTAIALTTYLIASCCSSFLVLSPAMCALVAVLVAGCLAALVAALRRERSAWPRAARSLGRGGALVLAGLLATAYGCGAWLSRAEAVRADTIVARVQDGARMRVAIGGSPRSGAPQGSYVILADAHEELPDVARFLGRELIQSGYQVVCLSAADPLGTAAPLARPLILLAMGSGCTAAAEPGADWRHGLAPDALILVDASASDGARLLADFHGPVLGIRGSRDEFHPSSATPAWFARAAPEGASSWFAPPWDRTWNRHFAALAPSLVSWSQALGAAGAPASGQPRAASARVDAPAPTPSPAAAPAVDLEQALTAFTAPPAAPRAPASPVGKTLRDLLAHAVPGLEQGEWIVVLYRSSCNACREDMPAWAAQAQAIALGISPGPPWAFINVDDHDVAPDLAALLPTGSPQLLIPHATIGTPLFIHVQDGTIISSGSRRDALVRN